MTYYVNITNYRIPLTGLWGNSEWCKADDVAHLCSIMATMYHALDMVNGHLGLNDREREAVAFALKRAHEVMP
jgi:hypothetical protein